MSYKSIRSCLRKDHWYQKLVWSYAWGEEDTCSPRPPWCSRPRKPVVKEYRWHGQSVAPRIHRLFTAVLSDMLRCTSFDGLIRQLGCFGTSHGTSPRPRRTRRSSAGETTDEDGRVGGVAGRNRQRWEHPESAGDQRSRDSFSAAAREAVKQWRFEPYYKSGQAVETEVQITVNFAISAH
jgi:hypothetical protein